MKIISGGQSGADLGGLEAAYQLGIETGGTAPAGYRTENGPNLTLKHIYKLTEAHAYNYNFRTKQNVKDSDGTVIFADDSSSPGTLLTLTTCVRYGKVCLINPNAEELKEWIKDRAIVILNVAGNRESKAPGIQKRVKEIVMEALKEYGGSNEQENCVGEEDRQRGQSLF